MAKICIADYQIKHYIGKMHVYRKAHLNDQYTWLRYLQENQWWATMGLSDIQFYIEYDCQACWERFIGPYHNIICGSIAAQPQDDKDWRKLLIEYLSYGYLKRAHISKRQHKIIALLKDSIRVEKRWHKHSHIHKGI